MQAFNPYLPQNVYIPDGEPHVFGERVYVFGSHDRQGGNTFCMLPYEVWSAPVDDLANWTSKGINYTAEDDPHKDENHRYLYAPDCVQGPDGRYYLYYCFGGYSNPISVAVCDTPDGTYHYYGDVHTADGEPLHRGIPFDPAVINDGGVIRLYYGAGYPFDNMRCFLTNPLCDKLTTAILGKTTEEIRSEKGGVFGPVAVTLQNDMLTVASEPQKIMPSKTRGTQWAKEPFFEASSIRKIGSTYYFVYSSWANHALCYATSAYPDRDFTYRGVIISNGDIGLYGRKKKDRVNATGNNHGGLVQIGEQWYIFYHRLTHLTNYSRQGCAEPITILPDGSIPQVEMTSCGLNNGPLCGTGTYPASICCNLTNGKMPHISAKEVKGIVPCIDDEYGETYVKNIANDMWVGYKYFDMTYTKAVTFRYRGSGTGKLKLMGALGGAPLAEAHIAPAAAWAPVRFELCSGSARQALFLYYTGNGTIDLRDFTLE